MPVYAQAVREPAPNFIPLKQGTWVVDENVLYHSLPELASWKRVLGRLPGMATMAGVNPQLPRSGLCYANVRSSRGGTDQIWCVPTQP
jgi:hypothetical protein